MAANRVFADSVEASCETFVQHREGVGLRHQTTAQPRIKNPVFHDRDFIETVYANGVPASYRLLKRTADVLIAAILLICFLPLIGVIVLAIKLTTPGAIVFRQIRIGKDMQLFTCYKFRSMIDNAEWHLEQDAELNASHAITWKLKYDPRITKVGRVLRKFSLDELPQLVNVIKGDMSVVGPRPYLPKELKGEFGERAGIITRVRPGMTGLWQVSGRALLTPSARIDLDEVYARSVNVKLDLFIIFKTFQVVLLCKGAF